MTELLIDREQITAHLSNLGLRLQDAQTRIRVIETEADTLRGEMRVWRRFLEELDRVEGEVL